MTAVTTTPDAVRSLRYQLEEAQKRTQSALAMLATVNGKQSWHAVSLSVRAATRLAMTDLQDAYVLAAELPSRLGEEEASTQ